MALFLVPGRSGDHNPAMFLLVASLLALVVGPLLFRLADRAQWALQALDGFIMVTVAGLVLVHVVPHSVAVAGPWALGLALVGFFGPGLLERHLERAARTTHMATLILACLGLVVHEFFDGVALGLPGSGHDHDGEGSILAMAVVLHRLPVAVTVWWLLRPLMGAMMAAATLAGLGLATVAGFAFAGTVAPLLEAAWTGLLQCLVAGSLLHVVIHRPPPLVPPLAPAPSGTALRGRGQLHAGLGALLGVVAVAGLADGDLPFARVAGEMSFRDTFLTLALELAPALLLGMLLAGLSKVFLPQASPRWMRTGRTGTEALRGLFAGVSLPVCACGAVPMYRSLLRTGAPVTAGIAFLIATPTLGLDAIAISLPLLGAELTLARVLAAMAIALCAGAWIGRLAHEHHAQASPSPAPAGLRAGPATRLRLGLRLGLAELVDDMGPWLLLGLVLASLIEPFLAGQTLRLLPGGADLVLFTLLGMPAYVCATGATPLMAVLIHKGVSPGAALAFLLAGPAIHVTVLGVLAELHGRRVALAFAGAIAGLVVLLGAIANAMLGPAQGFALHQAAHAAPGLVAGICLAALAGLLALSVLRLGPRGFIGQVLFPHGDQDGCSTGCSEDSHHHGHVHEASSR
jgi:uncharacterized membrane protein YraQ (UPF0718 family)